MTNSNQPLTVEVRDEVMAISIGNDTLAWAFEHQEDNNPYDESLNDYRQAWKITEPLTFAWDVKCELQREEEDGTTPLHLLFDKVCMAAIENGCGGSEECTDNKSAYARDYEKEGHAKI